MREYKQFYINGEWVAAEEEFAVTTSLDGMRPWWP